MGGNSQANYLTMNRRARRRRYEGRNTKQQLERIYHRDHATCQICKLHCKREDATRDHYPKPFHLCTKDEARSDKNIRLAHSWCNNAHGIEVAKHRLPLPSLPPPPRPPTMTQNVGLLFPQLSELELEMGSSSEGILAFGYNLGGFDFGFKFSPGLEELPWYSEDDGFVDSAEWEIAHKIAGFNEFYDPNVEGFWSRRNEAFDKAGVRFVNYGTLDYTGYILAVKGKVLRSNEGAESVKMSLLVTLSESALVKKAIEALGITLHDDMATWHIASYYG